MHIIGQYQATPLPIKTDCPYLILSANWEAAVICHNQANTTLAVVGYADM